MPVFQTLDQMARENQQLTGARPASEPIRSDLERQSDGWTAQAKQDYADRIREERWFAAHPRGRDQADATPAEADRPKMPDECQRLSRGEFTNADVRAEMARGGILDRLRDRKAAPSE